MLLRQGQALLDSGDVRAACFKFEAAETLETSASTLLRLGDCYQRAGRSASAWHAFLEAEAVARSKKDSERAQLAAQRALRAGAAADRVEFVVPMTSRVPGLTVRLGSNTVPQSAWGTRIPIDAGVQRVSASAKGYDPWSVEIDASHAEGQSIPRQRTHAGARPRGTRPGRARQRLSHRGRRHRQRRSGGDWRGRGVQRLVSQSGRARAPASKAWSSARPASRTA